MLNYPKAIDTINKNPNLKAKDMLGMFKPLETLIEILELEQIGSIGEIVGFNETIHNAINCEIKSGSKVEIYSVGYKSGDIVLTKAGVKEV